MKMLEAARDCKKKLFYSMEIEVKDKGIKN